MGDIHYFKIFGQAGWGGGQVKHCLDRHIDSTITQQTSGLLLFFKLLLENNLLIILIFSVCQF